jgi:hypothetical protein
VVVHTENRPGSPRLIVVMVIGLMSSGVFVTDVRKAGPSSDRLGLRRPRYA